jgi:linoleoyl-CoA desaturase
MLRFASHQHDSYFSTVKKRVDNYFKENHLSKHANKAMITKSLLLALTSTGLYLTILTEYFPNYIQLLLAVLLGMDLAFIGFNISHDAIHGAYSSNKKINNLLGLSFNLLGANAYVWNITHNIVHHTYTNISGHDEDIEIAPGLIRVLPEEKKYKIHRYQHIYAFALYSLASIAWVFRKDYVKFFNKKVGQYQKRHPKKEYFNLFFYKAVYYSLFIVVPLLVMDITWWQFLIGFLVMHIAKGLVLGLIFQLAHVVEGTEFPHPDQTGNIQESWAAHQMRTTANFARKNRLINYLCGGLNHQIEHHLFPTICHIHYPKIADIVKETAHEFGLPYIENPTFVAALKAHSSYLKKLGR